MSAAQDLKPTADKLLAGAVASGATAGVAALAVGVDGPFYEGAAGTRVLGGDAAMDIDTVCWLASMTKPIVSVAATQLVERGAAELDAPASGVLPELATIGVLTGFDANGVPQTRAPKRPITLRHLLTHTSGFGYELFSADVQKAQAGLGLPDLSAGKLSTLSAPLLFDPGDRWEYGVSIDWVGRFVEAVSGQSLGAYLEQNVLGPLGMSSTGFKTTPAMRERRAGMHMRVGEGLAPFPFEPKEDGEFEAGGGGMSGSARDYGRFVAMVLNDGALDGQRVLGAAGMRLVRENQMGAVRTTRLGTATPMALDNEFFPGVEKAWSTAFQINLAPTDTGRSAGALMWAGLSNCYFWIDPARRTGGVVLMQTLPFADAGATGVWLDFEKAVYASAS